MSEPEKKEKTKKKKVSKEKEEGEIAAQPDAEGKASDTPERKGSEKQPSRKASNAELGEKEVKSRKTSAADGVEKEPKSRKSSSADGIEKKGSKSKKTPAVTEEPKPVTEDTADEEDDDEMPFMPPPPKEWVASDNPFQGIADAESIDVNAPVNYFEAPPESTKNDIDLLQDLDTRRLAELMEAFAMFDFDQDGVISENDLRRTFASLDRPDVQDEYIEQMLKEGLNPLDFDAFIVLMGYKTLELDAEEVLTDALSQWDYGTEGLISEDRMRRDLMAFGDKFSEEEAAAALEDAPVVVTKNKEKMIDYIKFSNDLCGLRKRMKDYQKGGKPLPKMPD